MEAGGAWVRGLGSVGEAVREAVEEVCVAAEVGEEACGVDEAGGVEREDPRGKAPEDG